MASRPIWRWTPSGNWPTRSATRPPARPPRRSSRPTAWVTSSPRPSRKPTPISRNGRTTAACIIAHATLLADLGKNDQAVAEVKKLMDGKNDRETDMALAAALR